MTTEPNIALHEARHALAAGVALVALGIDRATYDSVQCSLWVSPGRKPDVDDHIGEFFLLPGVLREDIHAGAIQLAALGPLAALPNVLKRVMKGGPDLFVKGGMSDSDCENAGDWTGPPTTQALVVRAVQHMENRIGVGGVARLSKLVRGLVVEDLPDLPPLTLFAPYREAEAALTHARLELRKALG
ncbi:MAG TPA: hypothetical protein VNQ78_18720 [Paracoccus sp. (in: a-proteobacteria)]|uniref:hypothetical protein n=1 Tax=Paracoccus sp. TaxID=267 RepID=UPI002C91F82C|nr:hypothetical protein [Paracoccus sp. (in: a-proteobacteria)]HWL58691.1 hypothetical protein [Paracoccus sp. (in: a-proteobacteria)]